MNCSNIYYTHHFTLSLHFSWTSFCDAPFPLHFSGCKLQTKPKAKWSQSGLTLRWQISEIKPRSKIYLNAIFTLPNVIADVTLAALKQKPDIAVKFYLKERSQQQQSSGKISNASNENTSHLGTGIEIIAAKRGVKNLRRLYKQRLCCSYHLSFSS